MLKLIRAFSARSGALATPRRALLYVPGNDEKKIRKAAGLEVDCICLDCEDGVAANMKSDARTTIARMLSELDFGRSEAAVRINPFTTGLAEEDLEAVLSGPVLPKTLVLPKVESPEDIHLLVSTVHKLLGSHASALDQPLGLISMCESATSLLNLRESFQAAARCPKTLLRHEACIFGGDDFAASIGATRSPGSSELMFARQSFVVHCRAVGVQPIDIVKIGFHANEIPALVQEAAEGAAMGFSGKQIIHPSQIEPVQAAFSPSPERVKWAKELCQAFQEHQSLGKGAFSFHGQMIDQPTMLQAKNVLALAGRI